MHTLTLPHQLLLLELDDHTGLSLLTRSYASAYGLAGAVVAELQWQGLLVPHQADRFVLRADASLPSGALALGAAGLEGRKPLPLKKCISRIPTKKLRPALLDELAQAGALEERQERHFLIFRRTRWLSLPGSPESTLIEHLRRHVEVTPRHSPPSREDLLLSLLRGCGLLGPVWSEPEHAALKPAIDQCTDRAPIGRIVHGLIEEMDAAMLVATVTAAGS